MLPNLVNARVQMDGILGERGLIENAVFHVPIKMFLLWRILKKVKEGCVVEEKRGFVDKYR